MIAGVLQRRNRYKRPDGAGFSWRRLRSQVDWREVAHYVGPLVLVVAGLGALAWGLNRPLRAVSIDGSFQRVSAAEIEQAVAPYLSAGFMSVNIDAIRGAVQAIPWVDRVRVQRRWPMGLEVTVVEQTAAARWNGSGLINPRGDLFLSDANDPPAALPLLSGPEGTEGDVAKRYFASVPLVGAAGLRIAALKLDARGAWEMDFTNGLAVRLGRHHVAQRIRRFVDTASRIVIPRLSDVEYVDMRYANGFAVGWRAGAGAIAPAGAARPAAS
ncbi:MAG: cell division protein FtsQ/DivIB, partial [Gammaproteobacteria bacterium]|nr:cell division protein FtsQ/DivIB [Gammaproteobacteria bacterium]